MVQRIDFRPEIATPAAPNEPSVEAVRRKVRSHVVDLTPALLSLRDPRLIPLLLRRQRAAQVQAHPRSRSRSR
ncbi:MAG TPA: hypothetical protein VFN74_12140, partial [Chloroflexota bacterium]|nr:hypothetical protein [Chloroflexota bacterium]